MNVILFDGICNLCNGAVTFVVKRDRKGLFRFVSLQSETGKSLLKRYAVESTNKTLYYFRNNRCYSKSTAILYILKDLGGFWQCLYPLILIPAKLRDAPDHNSSQFLCPIHREWHHQLSPNRSWSTRLSASSYRHLPDSIRLFQS